MQYLELILIQNPKLHMNPVCIVKIQLDLPPDTNTEIWEADGLRLRGFKMSNSDVIFLPANTTSHIQPQDAGIIVNFKAKFRGIFTRWILCMLDSGHSRDSEEARPNMRQAFE
jgi:hypothetical protein